MASTEELILKIDGKPEGAVKALDAVEKKAGLLSIKFKDVAKVAALAFGALTTAVGFAIKEFAAQDTAQNKVLTSLASTGHAAGLTAKELSNLATSLQKTTTFSDEAVLEVEALLLSFTKIGKEVFPEATRAILDLSTKMGIDLKSATIAVGKALNEPAEGLSALSRAGVTFSADQEAVIQSMVDTGNVALAQAEILKQLNVVAGGSATSATLTLAGSLQQLKNSFSDVLEALGAIFVPVITEVVTKLKSFNENVVNGSERNKEAFRDFTEFTTGVMFALVNTIAFTSSQIANIVISSAHAISAAVKGDFTKAVIEGTQLKIALSNLFFDTGKTITDSFARGKEAARAFSQAQDEKLIADQTGTTTAIETIVSDSQQRLVALENQFASNIVDIDQNLGAQQVATYNDTTGQLLSAANSRAGALEGAASAGSGTSSGGKSQGPSETRTISAQSAIGQILSHPELFHFVGDKIIGRINGQFVELNRAALGLAHGTSGGSFRDRIPARLSPGEMVIPESFARGIKNNRYALTGPERNTWNRNQSVKVNVGFNTTEASRILTSQTNQDTRLKVRRFVA